MIGLDVWIRARTSGRGVRLSYDKLGKRDERTDNVLHELYEIHAELACMCNPERPVPMHLRRLRIRPPSYTVVTNPYHEHTQGCPRYRPPDERVSRQSRSKASSAVWMTPENEYPDGGFDLQERRGFLVPSLVQLNPAQREAAIHKDGPCIVVAAAGSGKTAMLIARIQFLIDSGADPSRILACTFTKKATQEMRARLVDAAGDKGKRVIIGTFHSIAYRMLMPELSEEWRVSPDTSWMMERVLEEPSAHNTHGVGPQMSFSDAKLAIQKAKADSKLPKQTQEPLAQVYAAYEALKTERKQLDFDDLLMYANRFFQTRPEFAKRWQTRWDYMLIDEYQDTNMVQWVFAQLLMQRTNNLFVVGDDWQSIYGFRSARPELMQLFTKKFPKAKRVFLSTNYRSHDFIVELGNRVIALNRGHQIDKQVIAHRIMPDDAVAQVITVETDAQEAAFVAGEMLQIRQRFPDLSWSDFAVLYRTNIQSRVYEEALAGQNIPYNVVGDTHFYESRSVKVILDYLRTTQDTSDPAIWGHLLNHPKRFIPRTVVNQVTEQGWEAMVAHPKCRTFVNTMDELRQHEEPATAISWLVNSLEGFIREQDEDEPIKWVDSLISSAMRYRTIPEFLRFVDWMIEQSKQTLKDAVHLSTIHRSKGLEYHTVFVVGLAEGLLPHNKSKSGEEMREETRLCYVGITRAKENLYLLAAKKYGDKEREPSRFIKALQG